MKVSTMVVEYPPDTPPYVTITMTVDEAENILLCLAHRQAPDWFESSAADSLYLALANELHFEG